MGGQACGDQMATIRTQGAVAVALFLAFVSSALCQAQTTAPAREYLDQAKEAATHIALPGDQSSALGEIALKLVKSDPAAALDLAARMRRPSDAARSLGAIAVAVAPSDPLSAGQNVVTAGRLLLRIASADQRLMEQRLLLREIAPLGEGALPAAPELAPADAQLEVVTALAKKDATAALALLKKLLAAGGLRAYDRAAAAIAVQMAASNPDVAIETAMQMLSVSARDSVLWRIAELRPPEEAVGIASRVSDPVIKSGILRSAILRETVKTLDFISQVEVSPTSIEAELAVAVAPTDSAGSIEHTRPLPELARSWALERITVALAASKPAAAETLLRDSQLESEATCLAAAAMATSDTDRALSLTRSLPSGETRDAALALIVQGLARSDTAKATKLLWEMEPSRWRDKAVAAVAPAVALQNSDQATGLIGLIANPAEAERTRARIASTIAGRDPDAATRLLDSLPPSDAKTTGAIESAVSVLAAGGQTDVAVRLGTLGIERDLAIRWIVPELARAQTRSPVALAGEIESPYLRALAFVAIAHELADPIPAARPAPERAMQIRPIVEWEGIAGNPKSKAETSESTALSNLELRISTPSALTARIPGTVPGALYRVTYNDGKHHFVWENLLPSASGTVILTDDSHLRPEYRMRCESRMGPGDPVVFDDLLKGAVVGKNRLPFGVPISTFGGPGYLVPGISDLKRDDFGNFWLYVDHAPYAILKYGPDFSYRFALLLPEAPVAHDLDGEGNLYVLYEGNWISKHGPLGENLGAWELPLGRGAGEFVTASGMAIDREAECIYLSDESLGRVQRFGLDLRLKTIPFTPWGWIGRGDMAYTRPGEYDRDQMYYQLDRPQQLLFDSGGNLLVSCEHYVSKFDLGTGKQAPFGRSPVLGWGVTFTESAFSASAGLDGHWQRQWLAGVDVAGNVYVADRKNEFAVNQRIQVFSADGVFIRSFDIEDEIRDSSGRRVYVTAVKGLVCAEDTLFIADAAGRIYRSPSPNAITGGGMLYLGAGAAGRQFDLSQADKTKFSVEVQSGRIKHRSEGRVLAYPGERRGTGNCEREGKSTLATGERSMWIPSRIGEPFTITLRNTDGDVIPPKQYTVEFEETPDLFGTQYDFFRVTNNSGQAWQGVTFVAESVN